MDGPSTFSPLLANAELLIFLNGRIISTEWAGVRMNGENGEMRGVTLVFKIKDAGDSFFKLMNLKVIISILKALLMGNIPRFEFNESFVARSRHNDRIMLIESDASEGLQGY